MRINKKSPLEELFYFQLKAAKFPEPEREFKFHEKRKWRFDFAYPELKVGIEIEGGTWSGGRHVRPVGFARDCEKYNHACVEDWKVFRFTAEMVKSGEAIGFMMVVLEKLIEQVKKYQNRN